MSKQVFADHRFGRVIMFLPAGPDSILGKVSFLVKEFSKVFPQMWDEYEDIWAIYISDHHLAIIGVQTIFILLRTATVSGLRCSI